MTEEEFRERYNKAMQGILFDIVDSLQSKLTQEHGKDTGMLSASILPNSKVRGNQIIIGMAEHGKYVEFGTPPHTVDPEDLEGWIQRKWLGNWKPETRGPYKSKKQRMEFVIKRLAKRLSDSIKKRGTRPYPFIRPTFINELVPIVKRNFENAFK